MITNAYSAGIYVKDQQKALEFWTEKLGFEVLTDAPMGEGARWIEVAPKGAQTRFILFTMDEQKDRIGTFSNIIFATPDIQKAYEELTAKGVEFKEKPSKQPWGWWAIFLDVDGNSYGMSQGDD